MQPGKCVWIHCKLTLPIKSQSNIEQTMKSKYVCIPMINIGYINITLLWYSLVFYYDPLPPKRVKVSHKLVLKKENSPWYLTHMTQ